MPFSRQSLKRGLTAAFLLIGGVAMVLTGVWIFMTTANFVRTSERAPGVVIEVVGERGARGTTLYYPVVDFRPRAQPTSIVFKAKPGLWPSPFDAGDRVTVAYKVDDPTDAKIVSLWTLWFLPAILCLFGLACLFAGRHTLARAV